MGHFRHESFWQWVISAGLFLPGLFRPDFRVGRFGLFWWVVSARYTPPDIYVFYNVNETAFSLIIDLC